MRARNILKGPERGARVGHNFFQEFAVTTKFFLYLLSHIKNNNVIKNFQIFPLQSLIFFSGSFADVSSYERPDDGSPKQQNGENGQTCAPPFAVINAAWNAGQGRAPFIDG